MSRKIVLIVAGLVSTFGALLSFTTQPADASGGTCKYIYSTGPIENAIGFATLSVADEVFIKVLNNDEWHKAEAEIKVFALNGPKHLIDKKDVSVDPQESDFKIFDVSHAVEWEAQVTVTGDARKRTLVAAFSKDDNGKLVAAQRVVHTEFHLKKVDCSE